ncbi:MAG: hypothetical protein IJ776_06140 [Paludibacteraceae bacterium]|nr:hypothetical protein [Paludibacteraceae bacterium]
MRVRLLIWMMCMFAAAGAEVVYSPDMFPLILQDIYEELTEEGREADYEETENSLRQLAENPINLNATTEAELRQLLFLTDEQIDAILLFAYKNPFHNLYELRLINELADYEIRNMLPFVYAGEPADKQEFYWREMWHYARQEADVRFDARNIENNGTDPFYASLKYMFRYKRKVDAGVVAERDPKEPFCSRGKTYGADFYGGWLQVDDVWKMKRMVIGDYRASFGQGLVLNTNMNYGGKAIYLYRRGLREEGLKRKSSTAEYDFFRGTGATIRIGITDVTLLYSARKIDGRAEEGVFASVQKTGYHRTESELEAKRGVWQQVAGTNVTIGLKRLKLGVTATEMLLGDTLRPRQMYYNKNYFQGKRQFAAGLNYDWMIWRLHLFGEIATAQNTEWGLANLTGLRIVPTRGLTLTALYRYYSPHYDNMLSSGFGETTKINDENGIFIGLETTMVKRWKFAAYGDYFRFSGPKYGIKTPSDGFDVYLTAAFSPSDKADMQWKLRAKEKGGMRKYAFRYTVDVRTGGWVVKAGAEANMVREADSVPTFGGVLYGQAEYHWSSVPIVLQGRVEAFYADNYDNRLYVYENDVLNAFSVPMIYGIGGRWYVNFRYRISETVSVYLKAAQTIYSDETVEKQGYAGRTRTEVHSVLRLKW